MKCRDAVCGSSSLYFGTGGSGSLDLGLANKLQVWEQLFLMKFIFYSSFKFT